VPRKNTKTKAPWGEYKVLSEGFGYKVREIRISPGHQTSYKYHMRRNETWIIISGTGHVTTEGTLHDACPGKVFFIPQGAKHRAKCKYNSKEPFVYVEVQTGDELEDDDLVRIDDDYGR
tara:strand:- start:5245 stop:5601 length:357 start_codon:yes stop_codon:yes gene_type:complete